MKHHLTSAILTLLAVQPVAAAIVPTAAAAPSAQALGSAQTDAVWWQGSVNGNTISASGTLMRGQDYDWVITAAHNIQYPQGTISIANMKVGNGTSYLNDRGLESGVSHMFISPSFVPGDNAGEDYAFLRLTKRISSPDLVLTLGAQPQNGAPILFAGYGLPASMEGGALPNTGNVMGFWGSFSPAGVAGWNKANDSGEFLGEHDSGVANYGDSGGSVKRFNTSTTKWENIGTIVGSDYSSATIFFAYYNAGEEFRGFLTNTVRPVTAVSEPPKVTCTVTPTAAHLTFANLETNREYRVMRSSSLADWTEAYRFTATATTASWSEALAPEGRRFYRLEWNE